MDNMTLIDQLRHQFKAQFSSKSGPRIFQAPGRVNLIGDHTDYNNGFVLPMAIDRRIALAARSRKDQQIHVYARNFNQWDRFRLDQKMSPLPANNWGNYLRAIVWSLLENGYRLKGMDAVIGGDVPIGAGLSSSAAMEVVLGYALLRLSGHLVDLAQLARMAQTAENEFVGMRCGIMDQFISCLGLSGHALLLDCRDLSYQTVPLPKKTAVVIVESGVRRGLVDGAYNDRRRECEAGAAFFKVSSLRQVNPATFNDRSHMMDKILRQRTRHVISENQRTCAAAVALETGDLKTAGLLFSASHASLRDDFQVSIPELDQLVEIATATEGVYGARMTGGGFGGCIVCLAETSALSELHQNIQKNYTPPPNGHAVIYVCRPSAGVTEVI